VGFFSGPNQVIADNAKELTGSKPIMEYLKPKTVAIPLKHMKSEAFDVHVEVGDDVKIGTKIATRNDNFTVPLFSSVSGKVIAIEKRDHVTLKKANHIIIENNFLDEKEPLFEPIADFRTLSRDDVVNYLKLDGHQGMSGDGYATYAKFEKVRHVRTVMLNGVECEPYITADEASMMNNADLLFEGLLLFIKGSGAKEGIIAIDRNRTDLAKILNETAKKYSDHYTDQNIKIKIQVSFVPDTYPMGWERTLIEEVLGFTYDINKYPVDAGVLVFNTTTAIEFARTLKTGLPLYERVVTLSGEGLANPQNVRVRIGTILKEVIDETGGYIEGFDPKNARLIAGGPFMGSGIITDELSIPAATGAFLSLVNTEKEVLPCLRCGSCIEHCPVGIQPVQIAAAHKIRDLDFMEKLGTDRCIECGACTFACPSFIEVADSTSKAKNFYLSRK